MHSVVLASSFSRLYGKLMKEREIVLSCLVCSRFGIIFNGELNHIQ